MKGLARGWAIVLGCVLLPAVVAAPASAGQTHVFLETFGSVEQPIFSEAISVAVDQSSGDVLVVEAGTLKISRYHEDGTPSDFSALGVNEIDAKGTGECPTVPADCDQTPENGFSFESGFGYFSTQIAIDDSGTVTDGNIYVTQNIFGGTLHLVDIFASTGEYLGQITGAGATSFGSGEPNESGLSPCGVTVDPAGNVYIAGWGEDKIYKFDPTANPPVNADHVASFTSQQPCSLATGAGPSAGSLFVTEYVGGVSKLSGSSGKKEYDVKVGGENRQVSVNPDDGHVFVASGGPITEYDASGDSSATLVSSFGSASKSVAVDGSSGRVYIVPNSGSQLHVYSGLVPLPDVEATEASNIGKTSATLNGTVETNGEELTECFFEYGLTTSYGSEVPCEESNAEIGTGFKAVHADIAGLQVETPYHFRLVAQNPNGTVRSDDQLFQTTSKPELLGEWAEDVTIHEATLKARINPQNAATTYRIEWGETSSYGNSTADIELGADGVVHTVTLGLDELTAATAYHWRVVASNELGVSEGEDHLFTTFALPIVRKPCPNDALRSGPSADLPDCRAYEMVSPLDKNGGDIQAARAPASSISLYTSLKQSSLDGEKVTYTASTAFGDAISAPYSSQYISTRSAAGWSTHSISSPRDVAIVDGKDTVPIGEWDVNLFFKAFTPDLCSAWTTDTNVEPLTPDGLEGYVNLYRRSNCGNEGYEALTNEGPLGPEVSPYLNDAGETLGKGIGPGLRFQGYSQDLSHQVFAAGAPLTGNAAPGVASQLYDLHNGKLELVSVLPTCDLEPQPACGEANPDNSSAGWLGDVIQNRQSNLEHAVSSDGSRIFWTSRSGEWRNDPLDQGTGKLYVRINGETTLPVSKAAEMLSGESASLYWTAAADGSAALFTTGDGNDLQGADADLYVFDVDEALAEEEATTLIAHQVRGVLGASEDLSRIYFVSTADLGDGATAGQNNLYLAENGTITLVAVLSGGGGDVAIDQALMSPINAQPLYRASRVTPDGGAIAFQALGGLTDYENVDPATGLRYTEVYHYDVDTADLTCVSCNPTGARPSGPLVPIPYTAIGNTFEGEVGGKEVNEQFRAAALLPTWEREMHSSRALSDDGNRIFFHSYEALVAGDNNGVQDVYQWEAQGTGSCEGKGGCLDLISTGTSQQVSEFYDASADGSDVFFSTTSGLDPRDEGLIDIYDARAGGGIAVPSPAPECQGDACQSIPGAPTDPTPAGAVFKGPGTPGQRPNCKKQGKRAAKLARKARRTGSPKLAKLAKRAAGKVKRCRRANRGGSK